MRRYIDADILSDALRRLTLGETDVARATMKITHYVSRMPTADVRENARGHWELKTSDLYGLADKVTAWANYCSVCGYHYGTPYNFCPHCGADMRGRKMSDYIKREDAIKTLEGWKISGEMILATVPSADVVEVVRCEDCVHCETRNNEEPYCHQHAMTVSGDYFCADGAEGRWTP